MTMTNRQQKPPRKRPIISGFVWLGLGLFLLGITTESLPPLQDSWPILIIIIGLALILGTVFRKKPQHVDQQNQGVH